MKRAAYSFFAAFIGWLLPFIGLMLIRQFGVGFGYITDFEFFLIWPLIFTFAGWLLVGLPVALLLKEETVQNLKFVLLISTGSTTVVFLLISALFKFEIIFLIWWPILIGLIGGSVFWLLNKRQPLQNWVFVIIPILFFPLIRFMVLPIGIEHFPYTTHVLAEGAIGNEALLNVIRKVEVGDTYQELHRRYPQIFSEPIIGTSYSSTEGGEYSIEFDEVGGKVIEVKVTD